MTFVLEEAENNHTEVIVRTDVTLSGSIAQYGRASGLINVVAGQIVSDFSENLKTDILDKQTEVNMQAQSSELGTEQLTTGKIVEEPKKTNTAKALKNELNVFSLLFAIIKSWFSRSK